MARTKFSELRRDVDARPGAAERLAAKRAGTFEEIHTYELGDGQVTRRAEHTEPLKASKAPRPR